MFDQANIVAHHIYHGGRPPPLTALAYQYIFAGNGVLIQAQSAHWQTVIPIAQTKVRGLPPITANTICRHGLMPHTLLTHIIHDAKMARDGNGQLIERLYRIHRHANGWAVTRPAQAATSASVTTTEQPDASVVLELHTHGNMSAFFSSTDTKDEQTFGVYAVLGNLDKPLPTFCARISVYGYFHPLSITELFTQPPAPLIQDRHHDSQHLASTADLYPHLPLLAQRNETA